MISRVRDALPPTFYDGTDQGGGNGVWRADVQYDWQPLPDGRLEVLMSTCL